MEIPQNIKILSIEDNQPDRCLIFQALKESGLNYEIYMVNNGYDALNFLKNNEKYNGAPTPDIILLDLNLPDISGFEILKNIKEDENLKEIPVVVLTGSDNHLDIMNAFQNRVCSYIIKPGDYKGYLSAMAGLKVLIDSKSVINP